MIVGVELCRIVAVVVILLNANDMMRYLVRLGVCLSELMRLKGDADRNTYTPPDAFQKALDVAF